MDCRGQPEARKSLKLEPLSPEVTRPSPVPSTPPMHPEKGALVAHEGGADLIEPHRVVTKDTTGAGDAFVGSFAVFLGEGLSESNAIARANLYAALSTTGVGTQKVVRHPAAFRIRRGVADSLGGGEVIRQGSQVSRLPVRSWPLHLYAFQK